MVQPILPQLSPPQYTFFNELDYTIGKDPLVDVENMVQLPSSEYLIPVVVHSRRKANALANILLLRKVFGGIIVNIEVRYQGNVVSPSDNTYTPQQIVALYDRALGTNRLYRFTVARPFFPGEPDVVFPVFRKKVIQFFNDDLSDLYNNFNQVAAYVFKDVLKSEISDITIFPSTEDWRKEMEA